MSEELEQLEPNYEEPKITGCPKCGSNDVRRSKSEGLWAGVQRSIGRWPFRCRSCRAKFYRPADPPEDLD